MKDAAQSVIVKLPNTTNRERSHTLQYYLWSVLYQQFLPYKGKLKGKLSKTGCKNPVVVATTGFYLEVTPGFEPGNEGFADPCLTTWLCHLIHLLSKEPMDIIICCCRLCQEVDLLFVVLLCRTTIHIGQLKKR